MGREADVHLIRALEKQIEEGSGDIIKLKRTRNSVLNISTRVPPEILGYIFAWSLARNAGFDGLRKGSYNFLLVCHHWFEYTGASGFWGEHLRGLEEAISPFWRRPSRPCIGRRSIGQGRMGH